MAYCEWELLLTWATDITAEGLFKLEDAPPIALGVLFVLGIDSIQLAGGACFGEEGTVEEGGEHFEGAGEGRPALRSVSAIGDARSTNNGSGGP